VLKLGCCISTSQKLVGRAQAFLVSGRFSCERVVGSLGSRQSSVCVELRFNHAVPTVVMR
jgi:hypothetical protein